MLAPMLNRRRTLLAVLLATPVAGCGQSPIRQSLYSRRAPEANLAGDMRWTDASRQRTLPLRLRLPSGDSQDSSPVPLVLFSHGLGGSVEAGTLWAQAWADAGIATLHLQHPGSDTELLRAEGPGALRRAANAEQLMQRALDVRFVLDELQRRAAELPRLRLDAVGLAGHSYGAHTTLAVAGQNYPGGRQAPLADARLRAFAAFSPSPGQGTRQTAGPGAFAGITRPVLCLTGSLDTDPFAPDGDERGRNGLHRRQVYDGLPSLQTGAKAELWLEAADHMSFGGQDRASLGRLGRPRDPATDQQGPRHRSLITATSTDWWRAHLMGATAARLRLAQAPQGLGPLDQWRRA